MNFFAAFKVGVNHKITFIVGVLLMAYILGAQSDKYYKFTNHSKDSPANISSDGGGYYAYLPQYLIYHTQHFEFAHFIQQKYPGKKFFEGISPNGKHFQDKYFVGTAICISPFFWITHQIVTMSGGEADGYSVAYQVAVEFAAIFFWFLGIMSLCMLCRRYGFSNSAILIGIVGLTFGTNLNYYIVYDPSFSHVYSFGLISFFLLQLKKFTETSKTTTFYWIFGLLGLITIIRPTNFLIVLLIPFFFENWNVFLTRLRWLIQSRKRMFAVGILLFLTLLFLQYLSVYHQQGIWVFNAYTAEGFDFLANPKIPEVLFGFRKGLFVYSPFLLLVIPAIIISIRWNKYLILGILLFGTCYVYLLASWWCWYYGGSLGMRAMIDIYGVLLLLIVLLVQKINRLGIGVLLIFVGFSIQYNLILNYQLQHSILHFAAMNETRFKQIFWQTDQRFEWIFFMQEPTFATSKFTPYSRYIFDSETSKWVKSNQRSSSEPWKNNLPSLMLIPDSSLVSSSIAVEMNYSLEVNAPKNVPKLLLFGYRNKQREELSVNFIGSKVPKRDVPTIVQGKLFSTKRYADFDSLEIIVENGEGKASNVACTIFRERLHVLSKR